MTAGDVWRRFGRWRHRRPFWGCVFLLLAGAELFYTANASLAGMSIHLGPTGFLSYLLPLILIVCALLCMFSPAQRLFYGIVGLLDALYSFIGLNLGGFFIGMLLGIIGGALVIAWGPPRIRPVDPDFVPIADQVAIDQEASETGEIKTLSSGDADAFPGGAFPGGAFPGSASAGDASPGDASPGDAETERVEVAGHDDRPTEIVPGFDDQEGPKSRPGRSRLSRNPKALTVAFIVMGLTAAMLAVGSRVPASAAADCPSGLPSRSASTSPSRTTAAADPAAARSSSSSKSSSAGGSSSTGSTSGSSTGGASGGSTASPTPSASKDKDGNPIADGVKGIVGGLGNLLGLGGDDPSSSPSASPSPSETPATPATPPAADPPPAPTGSTPDPTGTTAGPAASSPATPTSAAPSAGADIPCLGPRVFGLNAAAGGIPLIAAKPGLLETDSLTMLGATYDGVVNLPTGTGTSARVLKFSMNSAENKPFSLTTDKTNGVQTVITSNDLTTAGNVKFYTERFEGKLFGLFPVVFTPDQPPPLTVPIMWFTAVKIQLNYVQCDKLTAYPLHIAEK